MTKAILAICLLGAVGSLVIGFAGGGWSLMSPEDVLIFPLVVGPYALLAAVAWWRRSSGWQSLVLLGTVLLITSYGFWAIGTSVYRSHSDPNGEVAMDLSPVVVPAMQWLVAVSLATLLAVIAGIKSSFLAR